MKITRLKRVLRICWEADTASGNWTPDCPSLHQCAVTSMLVQDYFGGDLLRCECNDGDSHYWNRLPNGEQVDLTEDQFAYSGVIPDKDNFVIRERSYVDNNENTFSRYTLLAERVRRITR